MPLVSGLGWRKFITWDTTIGCVTRQLRSVAENNIEECRKNPALQEELFTRCRSAIAGALQGTNSGLGALPGATNQGQPVAPFRYEEEPLDEWKDWALLAETSPGQTIHLDCDCVSPVWAAFFRLRWAQPNRAGRIWLPRQADGVALPIAIGISQPKTRPCRCRAENTKCVGVTCTPEGPRCDSCGYGMAHAYTVLEIDKIPPQALDTLRPLLVPMEGKYRGKAVVDGSVWAGMQKPRGSFYGSGETAIKPLRDEADDDEREAV